MGCVTQTNTKEGGGVLIDEYSAPLHHWFRNRTNPGQCLGFGITNRAWGNSGSGNGVTSGAGEEAITGE